MCRRSCVLGLMLVAISAAVPSVWGEWSDDAAANLAIADRSGAQVQPKLVATADGGFYVSWFDNSAGGYDVYLQRLDASGNEQWAHNGVLIADREFSSTQDYGLGIDTLGNALLAFRDDRGGSSVTVAKVSVDGTLVWGSAGIQVYSGSAFIGPIKVAGTSDGNMVVAWSLDSDAELQKLDPDGMPMWGAGVSFTPAAGSYAIADLHAAEAGTAIVSFTHTTGSFPSPIQLWAQKLAAVDGALLWGAGHVQVFDLSGGSLQIGNFPPFTTDGAGGAVFAWYSSTPTLQCRVQRVLANGSEAFVHDGVEVSTNATRLRVSPSAAFSAANQEVFVFWTEENTSQSSWGLYGQKLDVSGARQWTDDGLELIPLSSSQITDVTTLTFDDEAVVAWVEPISFGNEPVCAARIAGDGSYVWDPPCSDVSTSPTGTSRLVGALSSQGYAAYAWSDGDPGSDTDILAQNLNPDGSLGPGLFADGFESGNTDAWSHTIP